MRCTQIKNEEQKVIGVYIKANYLILKTKTMKIFFITLAVLTVVILFIEFWPLYRAARAFKRNYEDERM